MHTDAIGSNPIDGTIMSNLKKKVMKKTRKPVRGKVNVPSKKVAEKKEAISNPFEIEENVIIHKTRGSVSALAEMLFEKVKELPVSKTTAVMIPKSVAPTKKDANSLVTSVRRLMKNSEYYSDWAISLNTYSDADGNYTFSRIWRIN